MNLDRSLHESNSVFILPLGGLGEIGMNFMALIHKGKATVLDSGVLFPEPNSLGVDLVTPDIEFFSEYSIDVEAVVFTHAHEDHIGSIAYLYDELGHPKLFATEYTYGMFEERIHSYSNFKKENFQRILPGKKFKAGSFEFEGIRVTHSMSDCLGFCIHTPVGRIVHTGDFKIDKTPVDKVPMDEKRFRELGDEGVLLLMSDSTNVESSGWTKSESDLHQSLQSIISKIQEGKIFVTMFSSNIPRIQGLLAIAKSVGRKVAFCGRSVVSNTELARRMGLLKFSDEDVIPARQVDHYPAEKVLLISTGTQAEPRSALSKMAMQIHPDVHLEKNDTVIFSSRHIPGNEKKISTLVNQIYRIGARVIDHYEDFVHVSGHAQQDELRTVLEWVRPKFFLPVHGEYRMLVKHAELANNFNPSLDSRVAENGDILELTPDRLRILTKVSSGKIFFDEHRNHLPEDMLRDRRKLAQNGLVVADVIVRQKDWKIIQGPELQLMGISDQVDLVNLKEEITAYFHDLRGGKDFDIEAAEEEIRLMTRRFYRKAMGLKPVVISRVYEV